MLFHWLTMDKLLSNLKGSTVLSSIDVVNVHYQVPLAEESHYLTAFITHDRLYRFCRVPYGLVNNTTWMMSSSMVLTCRHMMQHWKLCYSVWMLLACSSTKQMLLPWIQLVVPGEHCLCRWSTASCYTCVSCITLLCPRDCFCNRSGLCLCLISRADKAPFHHLWVLSSISKGPRPWPAAILQNTSWTVGERQLCLSRLQVDGAGYAPPHTDFYCSWVSSRAVRTKQRLHALYCWPKMDNHVLNSIRSCYLWQSHDNRAKLCPAPWQPVSLPHSPWQNVAINIVGPFETATPDCRFAITMIGYYSKWPEEALVRDIATGIVLTFLSTVVCRHGNPLNIVTNNGVQFTSASFTSYLQERQNNSNCLLKQNVQLATQQHPHRNLVVIDFLQVYHSTPHATTGSSPYRLPYGRSMRTKPAVLPRFLCIHHMQRWTFDAESSLNSRRWSPAPIPDEVHAASLSKKGVKCLFKTLYMSSV